MKHIIEVKIDTDHTYHWESIPVLFRLDCTDMSYEDTLLYADSVCNRIALSSKASVRWNFVDSDQGHYNAFYL
jgi:hypothetical protein